jgi:DNA (cytosine-5)-methyltransferase 1
MDRADYNQGINAKYDFAVKEEQAMTLVARGPSIVCKCEIEEEPILLESNQNHATIQTKGICTTLPASMGMGGGFVPMVSKKETVRRLTPLECERLQGFPDGWTDIGDWIDTKGKKHKGDSDAPRYKALGNSIALPFWAWMAERMCAYLKEPTMASLFDGIGGFPLVFSWAGCKPIWASEIEEFPIAVTKKRFGEE